MDKELRFYLISMISILALCLIIIILVLIKNHRFHKTFSLGKLSLSGSVYIDEITKKKTIGIVVANKTINPITISSTGICYNHMKINMIENISQLRKKDDYKVATIDSRNSILFTIDYLELFDFVTQYKRIRNIYLYSIDTLGVETICLFKHIKKIFKYDLKLKKKGLDITVNFEAVLGKNNKIDNDIEEALSNIPTSKQTKSAPFDLYRDDKKTSSNISNDNEEEVVYEEVYVDEDGNEISVDESSDDDSNNIF